MTMSKSDSGKLGAIKSAEIGKLAKDKRIITYNLSPKLCLECNSNISYEKRQNRFCSRSCGAIYSNMKKDKKVHTCMNCGIPAVNKYCSIKCQQDYQRKEKIINWKNGNKIDKNQIKRYLSEKYGYKCSVCGISEWNTKKIELELEHRDGNSENNVEENLCLICPNCHSQTDTYKAKNKGNGRYSRMIRYREGKSF